MFKTSERKRETTRAYYKANRSKILEYASQYQKDNPNKTREKAWKSQGIKLTYPEYLDMKNEQNYRCGICKIHESELDHSLSVDHDHVTGKVRGLLCHECNNGLGRFKDDIELLMSAARYLHV